MAQDEALFPRGRYRKRRQEIGVDADIADARKTGQWEELYRGAAGAVRAQARAVDLAEQAAETLGTPYSISVLTTAGRELRETLAAYGLAPSPVGGTDDPFNDWLASLNDPASQDHRPTP